MKKLTISLMIDFLEGKTSKNQSKEIKEYISLYPYYNDILEGLKSNLEQFGNKVAVLTHLRQQKKKSRKNLFLEITSKTTVI